METYVKFGEGLKITRTDESVVSFKELEEHKSQLESQVAMLTAEIKEIENKLKLGVK